MEKRDRFIMLICMHFFGPIYFLYWICKTQNETNRELEIMAIKRKGLDKLSGGFAVFLSIITLYLFTIVWQYYLCRKIVRLGGKGKYFSITLLYLLLIIPGLVFNPLVLQGEMNMLIRRKTL